MVKIGGCISIKNKEEFSQSLMNFKNDKNLRKLSGVINKRYIKDNLGATKLIMNYLKTQL